MGRQQKSANFGLSARENRGSAWAQTAQSPALCGISAGHRQRGASHGPPDNEEIEAPSFRGSENFKPCNLVDGFLHVQAFTPLKRRLGLEIICIASFLLEQS